MRMRGNGRTADDETEETGDSCRRNANLLHPSPLRVGIASTSSSFSIPSPNATAAALTPWESEDVNFLYPQSSTTSSLGSPVSLALKPEAVPQLQLLLQDFYRRYGTAHPVFASLLITPQQRERLIHGGEEGTRAGIGRIRVGSGTAAVVGVAAGGGTREGGDQGKWNAGREAVRVGVRVRGELKIMSSSSIEKHRAGCVVHRERESGPGASERGAPKVGE